MNYHVNSQMINPITECKLISVYLVQSPHRGIKKQAYLWILVQIYALGSLVCKTNFFCNSISRHHFFFPNLQVSILKFQIHNAAHECWPHVNNYKKIIFNIDTKNLTQNLSKYGWIKLNTNSSVLAYGQAAIGIVTRDHHGSWLACFAKKVGSINILKN